MDTELDIAMIQNISREVRQKTVPLQPLSNKLTKTPMLNDFRDLAGHLKESGKMLFIEITEYMEHDMPSYQAFSDELNTLGIRLAIDDYGAGYSSQSFISNISPAIIKIDRELITDIDRNKRKETLVQGIVDYCNYIGIGCVAEGVSNRREMLKVIELGVHFLQGFYLGRPSEQPLDLSEEIRSEILEAVGRFKKDGKVAY
jgi:EAL domain-containing protein (putative c-di-GMP-specific phosphodiesterase class I)